MCECVIKIFNFFTFNGKALKKSLEHGYNHNCISRELYETFTRSQKQQSAFGGNTRGRENLMESTAKLLMAFLSSLW